MKARTPIGEIDLGVAGPFVLILDQAEARPVYHRRDLWSRSSCGIERSRSALVLAHRHAKRFARPCLRCWPELRTGQLELKAGPL